MDINHLIIMYVNRNNYIFNIQITYPKIVKVSLKIKV